MTKPVLALLAALALTAAGGDPAAAATPESPALHAQVERDVDPDKKEEDKKLRGSVCKMLHSLGVPDAALDAVCGVRKRPPPIKK